MTAGSVASLSSVARVRSLRVGEWNLEQLKKLDCGSWFVATDPFATIADGLGATQVVVWLLAGSNRTALLLS